MELAVPKFVAYISAWFGIMGGLWALFDRAEVVLKKDIREQLSNWLRNDQSDKKVSNWALIFTSVFDKIFGEKHLSWKCFLRSSIASISVVIIMFLIMYSISGMTYWSDSYFTQKGSLIGIIYFIFITFFINLIPDYFSLLETRLIIKWMTKKNMVGRFVLLLFDLLVTSIIFLFALAIGATLLTLIVGDLDLISIMYIITEAPIAAWEGLLFWQNNDSALTGVWIYSTYFTSIWIWIFFISGLAIKIFSLIGIGLKTIGKLFDTEEKPLRSLGFISMMWVTIIFIILPLL